MAKWQVGPPTKKGRYHIAYIDEFESDKPIVSECTYDGESDWVEGISIVTNNLNAVTWTLFIDHIKAHKPYPTITKHWIEHLEEYKKPGVRK
jgi:hypothetical protein